MRTVGNNGNDERALRKEMRQMPKTIKAVVLIVLVQVSLAILLLVAAFVMLSHKATHGFWLGFQSRLVLTSGASSLQDYGPYHAGYISGATSISLLLLAITLWGIIRRRFWPVVIATALLILAAFGQQSFPLLSIVVMILVCSGSGRSWLQRKSSVACAA